MTALADRDALPSYAGPFRTALLIMACLAATIVGWGMYARLDAAVVTHGVMLAESQRKTVEHFEGGILRTLYVKAGDRVHEGQVVAQLDATQVEAAIARLGVDRDALAHEIWRLAAEEAGAGGLDPATAPEPGGPQALAAARLFAARAEAQASQLAALDRQRDELTAQVAANEGVAAATERQLASWQAERATAESLVAKGATPRQKLLEFDRNVAALEGQRDEARSLAAAAREGIARTASERRTLEQKRLVEIGEQLVEARRALAGVAAELRAAGDVLERSRLRAPQDGLVVHVGIVTPGAVVASGAPVMEIIPDGDRLVVETRLPPDAIDTVHVGRLAKVRLTAFKRAVAPSVDGEVIYVSADLLENERDGEPYFDARVALDPDSVAALGDAELTAGMPVEVAIQTGERRAGEYFLEPLLRHMRRALRDE